jgi:hypothetical protein
LKIKGSTVILLLLIAGLVWVYVLDGQLPAADGGDDWEDQTPQDPSDPDAPDATVEFQWGIRGSTMPTIFHVDSGTELDSGYVELYVSATVTVNNAAGTSDLDYQVMPVMQGTSSPISAALSQAISSAIMSGSQPSFTGGFSESWVGLDYSDLGIPNEGDEITIEMLASVSTTATRIGGGAKSLSISGSRSPSTITLRHTSEPSIQMVWGGAGAQD